MICLDKYRAAAKRSAWYDDSDDETNYNPFRKIHRRNKATVIGGDEESATRIHTNMSEARIIQQSERDRRSKTSLENYGPAPHANTMPANASVPSSSAQSAEHNGHIQPVSKEMAYDGDRNEKSQDSGTGTSDTVVATPTANSEEITGARRRKQGFLQKVHLKKQDPETAPEPEKRRSSFLTKDKESYTFASQIKATLLNSWINILLVFVPIGIAVNYAGIPKVAVFIINFIAIIPLAAMLSYATEEIALRTGETIGGLLNATFGYDASMSCVRNCILTNLQERCRAYRFDPCLGPRPSGHCTGVIDR